jgi:hypothetical protein
VGKESTNFRKARIFAEGSSIALAFANSALSSLARWVFNGTDAVFRTVGCGFFGGWAIDGIATRPKNNNNRKPLIKRLFAGPFRPPVCVLRSFHISTKLHLLREGSILVT